MISQKFPKQVRDFRKTMSPEIYAAFLVGLVGSLHCIGMCGPIAIALPVPDSSNLSFFTGRILYNLGRVVTYAFLGAVLGLVGSKIALAGAQQVVSIVLGVIIITTPSTIETTCCAPESAILLPTNPRNPPRKE